MDSHAAEALLDLAKDASAGMRGADGKQSLVQLEERSGDLLSATEWFLDSGRTDEALRLANALYRFWITKQQFDVGAVWFHRVLAAPGGDETLRGQALLHAGFMPFWLGDDQRAAELFGQSWRLAAGLAIPR
jgi:hypothetical protein